MKSIRIVTHCWNPPGTKFYSEMLKWQLASLVNNPPENLQVCILICGNSEDLNLVGCILKFPVHKLPDNITILLSSMPKSYLFRRAIGRNTAVNPDSCNEDVIWFTDCDYLFGEGCLNSVYTQVTQGNTLYYPKTQLINVDHQTGTQMVLDNHSIDLPKINPELFMPKKINRAIGGVQIISGETARRVGYLDNTEWTEPVSEKEGFRSCHCDVAWRSANRFPTVAIDVPNLYRIRHEVNGRDLDLKGNISETT